MLSKLLALLFHRKHHASLPPFNRKIERSNDFDDADRHGLLDYGGNTLHTYIDRELPQMLPLELPAHIEYCDGMGNRSSRDIEIHSFAQDGVDGWVNAFCVWRQAERSFIYRRIDNFIDRITGEVMSGSMLAKYLFDLYIITPHGKLAKPLQQYKNILRVLISVARADRRMTVRERQIIVDYLLELAGLPNSDDLTAAAHQSIKEEIFEYGSIRSFNSALRQIAQRHPQERERLYAMLEKVVAADKKTTTEEQKYIDWAKKILIINE